MADGIAIEEISDEKGLLTAEVVGGVILHSLTVILRLGEIRDVVLGLADIGKYFRRRDTEFAPPKNTSPTFAVRGDSLIVEYPNGEAPDNYIFFNLKGHGVGNIEDHNLTVFADRFVDEGRVVDVTDTPLDFRRETPIGERIRVGFETLVRQKGYDHIYILNGLTERISEIGEEMPLAHAATLLERMRRLQMDVYTSFPALHLYTGNRLNGRDIGKGGCIYPHRGGVALMPCSLPWEKAAGSNRVIYRFTTKETTQ